MPFSGGIWTPPALPGSWSPAISGQAATPGDWNTLLTAIAAGLSTMICKDGQSVVAADIPFAGFKLKAVGNATLVSDAPNLGQIQSGAGVYAPDTGTADLYAIAPSPAISAYAVGQIFRWSVLHANATTTPTLAVSGLTAGTIVWPNGSALVAGNLPAGANVQTVVSAVTTGTPTHQLLTVTTPVGLTAPTFQVFTSGSAATYTTPAGVKWIRIRMAGGGGGGGGVGLSTGPTGATGGDTIFNSIHAAGAVGGGGSAGVGNAAFNRGGAGGSAGSGSVAGIGYRVAGAQGGDLMQNQGGQITTGGAGAGSAFFGGGGASAGQLGNGASAAGNAAIANTGGGGAGAVGASTQGAAGGGGAECVEFVIGNPAATYTYTVGASGAGGIGTGTGAATGGAGAAGQIIVEEHYNF